tara:strand:+ start:32 stop:226 length:195 start_codon:yes stop_codon:yes gene_type:complete
MAKEKYEHERIVNAIYNEVYSMDVEQLIGIAVNAQYKKYMDRSVSIMFIDQLMKENDYGYEETE